MAAVVQPSELVLKNLVESKRDLWFVSRVRSGLFADFFTFLPRKVGQRWVRLGSFSKSNLAAFSLSSLLESATCVFWLRFLNSFGK